jgi:hypothetical protein
MLTTLLVPNALLAKKRLIKCGLTAVLQSCSKTGNGSGKNFIIAIAVKLGGLGATTGNLMNMPIAKQPN